MRYLNLNYRKIILAGSLFLLASVAVLWAWNTLAELFALPPAQYKHALAVLLLLSIVRSGRGARLRVRQRERGGGQHEHSHC